MSVVRGSSSATGCAGRTAASGRAAVWVLLLGASICFVPARAAFAAVSGAPVALVMEVEGKTTPPVEKHQELLSDSRVTLAKGARISVLHYLKCTIYTVRGGVVTTTEAGVEPGAGKIESTRPGPCPRVQRVTVGGQAATSGVVLSRSIAPSRPSFSVAAGDEIVLTGTLGPRAVSSEIVDAGGKVVSVATPIRSSAVRLAGNRVLTTGERYQLRVKVNGVEQPVVVPLAVVDARSEGPLILRLE